MCLTSFPTFSKPALIFPMMNWPDQEAEWLISWAGGIAKQAEVLKSSNQKDITAVCAVNRSFHGSVYSDFSQCLFAVLCRHNFEQFQVHFCNLCHLVKMNGI